MGSGIASKAPALALAALGHQLLMILWLVISVARFADLEFEDYPIYYLGAVPVALGLLAALVLPSIYQKKRVAPGALAKIVAVGLVFQQLAALLLYLSVARVGALGAGLIPGGDALPSGWTSTETTQALLAFAWLSPGLLLVVPAAWALVLGTPLAAGEQPRQYTLAGLMVSAAMLLQFGGPWAAPVHFIAVSAVYGTLLSWIARELPPEPAPQESPSPEHPLLLGPSIYLLVVFWGIVVVVESRAQLGDAWLWGWALAGYSAVAVVQRRRGSVPRTALAGAWALLGIALLLVALTSVSQALAAARPWLLAAGLVGSGAAGELLWATKRPGQQPGWLRRTYGLLVVTVCCALTAAMHSYDPLSTYVFAALGGSATLVGVGWLARRR